MQSSPPPLERILLLHNPYIQSSCTLSDRICAHLHEWGRTVTCLSNRDHAAIVAALPSHDVVLTLGGDGSMLRAARLAALAEKPILGVNFGKLGFLAELEPEETLERLPSILSGGYWVEHRVTVRAELLRDGAVIERYDALNEVVVARRALCRVVRIRTYFNDQYLTTYTADGVIVSTATGSTAYALAAGGPILHPEVRTLIFKPICPHLALDRALVLPPTTTVRLEVETEASHEATLSVDGQDDVPLEPGDSLRVATGPLICRFIRSRQPDYFYASLLNRLKLT